MALSFHLRLAILHSVLVRLKVLLEEQFFVCLYYICKRRYRLRALFRLAYLFLMDFR